VFPT
jgi:hypothetical protein